MKMLFCLIVLIALTTTVQTSELCGIFSEKKLICRSDEVKQFLRTWGTGDIDTYLKLWSFHRTDDRVQQHLRHYHHQFTPCDSVSDAYVLSLQIDIVLFVVKSEELSIPVIGNSLNRVRTIDDVAPLNLSIART